MKMCVYIYFFLLFLNKYPNTCRGEQLISILAVINVSQVTTVSLKSFILWRFHRDLLIANMCCTKWQCFGTSTPTRFYLQCCLPSSAAL